MVVGSSPTLGARRRLLLFLILNLNSMDQNPTPPPAGKQNTVMAIIAYILFFVPLLTGDAKKDAFVKFHTKQGLVLFILVVLINIIDRIIPFYFWWSINW